jgi:hypothetical protein
MGRVEIEAMNCEEGERVRVIMSAKQRKVLALI